MSRKEDLARAETVRQLTITLSHHINNDLAVIDSSLALLQEQLNTDSPDIDTTALIHDCRQSVQRINRVLSLLQKSARLDHTSYYYDEQMLDIEVVLHLFEEALINKPPVAGSL